MATLFQVLAVMAFTVGCLQAQITAPPGLQGQKGEPGLPGAAGTLGEKGDIGPPGEPGEKGGIGLKGAAGAAGDTGDPGVVGLKGGVGAEGQEGIAGQIGENGVVGLRGVKGSVGATGATGSPGKRGPKGPNGERGDVGQKGVSGIVGAKGEKGTDGTRGLSGEAGDMGVFGSPGQSLLQKDKNECEEAQTECDDSSTFCVNWATGSRCVCKAGYQPKNDSITSCQDIDECEVNNGDCPGTCINSIGSFTCSCPSATSPTANHQCTDLNECSTDGICEDGFYCINKYNGYSCVSPKLPTQVQSSTQTPVAQALSTNMMNDTWIIILLAWFGVLTFITIVILIWLIHVFHKMKKERAERNKFNTVYDTREPAGDGGSDDEEPMPEGMAGSADMHIDVPRLPRSQRGTLKGAHAKGSVKGSKSYKSGSRQGSVSSSTGAELRTASVKQTRVAAGERNSANRLSAVDTYY